MIPLFWVAIGMTALIVPVTAWQIFANATMVAGYLGQEYIDGVYWTLQVELKFYVLIGLLLACRQGDRLELWIALWLLGSVAAEWVPALRPLVIYPYSPLFIAGAACFLIRSQGMTVLRAALFVAATTLSVQHAVPLSQGFVPGDSGLVPLAVVTSLHGIMLLVAMEQLPLRCPLWAAATTYPLYLVHNQIGRWLQKLAGGGWVGLAVALAGVCALAYLLSQADRPLGSWIKAAADTARDRVRNLFRPAPEV